MKRFELTGKVALVTGGNGGIGAGIARGLLECGAAVVIAGRNEEKNESAVAELAGIGPKVSALALDVTDEAQCRAAVAEVVKRYGRLDILVNNAGIGAPGRGHAAFFLAQGDRYQPHLGVPDEPACLSRNEKSRRGQDH
jgi:2-deoxy-D-gluconate 3-dehydrogenase